MTGMADWMGLIGQGIQAFKKNTGMGEREGEVSFEQFGRSEDMANIHNTNEIGRQTAYLKGITPAQAASYNTYQDATFGEDTRRQTERIQQQAQALGMSNWELMGQGGGGSATPVPAEATNASAPINGTAMMSAELQAKTSLAIAAMNNATQLSGQQTQRTISGQATADGQIGKAEVERIKAVTDLTKLQQDVTKAQEAATVAGTTATISDAMVRKATAIFQMLPRDTTSMPGLSRTETPQAYNIITWLQGDQTQTNFEAKIRGMSPDDLSKAIDQFKSIIGTNSAKVMTNAGTAMENFDAAMQAIGKSLGDAFLKGQGPGKAQIR